MSKKYRTVPDRYRTVPQSLLVRYARRNKDLQLKYRTVPHISLYTACVRAHARTRTRARYAPGDNRRYRGTSRHRPALVKGAGHV